MPAATPLYSAATQPIEHLAERVSLGEIVLRQAEALAADATITSRLTADYTRSVQQLVLHLAGGGHAKATLVVAQLLRAAIEALPDDATWSATREPGEFAFLRGVRGILPERPDWQLYREARAVAARLLRRGRRSKDTRLIRRTFAEMGELHFQPLVATYSGDEGWAAMIAQWYEHGRALSGEGKPFPPPPIAFSRARREYRQAARGAPDEDRRWLLKGQVSALEWLQKLRGQSYTEEICALATEALPLMDARVDLVGMTYLMALLHQAGRPIDAEIFQRAVSIPVEELIRLHGPSDTVSAHINLAHLIQPIDAKLALALIERAAPAVVQAQDETVLARHSNALLSALIATMSDDQIDNAGGTLQAAQEVRRRAEAEAWPLVRVAGALLHLVERCDARNEELLGLRLLDAAEGIFPDAFQAYPAAFKYWRMTLWAGEGVNNFKATPSRPREALLSYGNALRLALPLGFREFALQQLKFFVDVGMRSEADLLFDFVGVLFDIGLKLEVVLGTEGVEQLQVLAQRLTERQMATGSINTNLLHLTWQVAKARRFSAGIRLNAARLLPGDETSEMLLAKIAELRAEVPLAEEGTGPGSRIDRTRRLLAFVRADEPASGVTALERLTNLQASFDDRLERRLAQHSATREAEVFGFEELRAALPERTALLQLFLGERDGKRAVHALLGARAGTWLNVTPDEPFLFTEFREADRTERAYSYEEEVYLLRSAILDETLDAAELQKYLHTAGGAFLAGGLGKDLDALRAKGCDHLLVVPHGPFHFAPLQLFARGERLLADEWNVTVLPSVELLRRTPPPEASGRTGLAAFGLSFSAEQNPHMLPALNDAVDEARRVAKAFGTQAITERDATESAVLAALARSEYLHFATHGAMNLDAPSFHYVVVTPEGEDDGLLHAHELLRVDLRGVRLVSLSACETALGRLDSADNPRGLPAALLLAGVESIVGTLWEVAGDVARAFFVALYTKLAAGEPRGEAFRAAQREARRRFPHPRDWGAFYFLGAWD